MEEIKKSVDTFVIERESTEPQNEWWESIELHLYFELAAILSKSEWDEIQSLALRSSYKIS
ncbi:MAG TPA: hypothetical protein PLJ00_03305 [Chitinophagales bacterium]|nr:hypothetical protein [Chitinophagales bacterium]HRG26894.1 hypothetical protein [Chitinophagales bacterium]HRG85216.1 hypothetical protein [Chitinophagales bacterium]HRH51812.1 hypothetical protein [Chitinophagales bacterium]